MSSTPSEGPFFHGTKADLKVGDLLTAGFRSNYRPEVVMNHIYFTAQQQGAGLAAELAAGEAAPRVYVVEPTDDFEDDPNVTDKKFPGNPTESYRSTSPLRILGEVTGWTRLTSEALATWRSASLTSAARSSTDPAERRTTTGGARIASMEVSATFTVASFEPADYVSPVTTGTSVGHAHMVKAFTGDLEGRTTTQFSFAFDQATGVGTYVAMEAFEGTLLGRSGAFAFAHSATTDGVSPERQHELLVIAPGSGSGDLVGLTGTGAIRIDDEGTHHLVLDVDLPAAGGDA